MKIRQGGLLAMLFGAVLLFVALIPGTANAIDTGLPIFSNSHRYQCLDERTQDPLQHARVQIWACQYRDGRLVPQQKWFPYFVKNYDHNGQNWRAFQILNRRADKCLEIPDSVPSTAPNGTQADLFTCDGTRASQLWYIEDLGGKAFRLINVNSGKCLDV